MLSVHKISPLNLPAFWETAKILSDCGDDMYQKYNISHWKNSVLKSFLIVIYSMVRYTRKVMGVYDGDTMIGTYQISKVNDSLCFGKLAISPSCSGQGFGTYCIEQMTKQAIECGCKKLQCEVYIHSQHALDFYLHKGFVEEGICKTLKYTEIKLVKYL